MVRELTSRNRKADTCLRAGSLRGTRGTGSLRGTGNAGGTGSAGAARSSTAATLGQVGTALLALSRIRRIERSAVIALLHHLVERRRPKTHCSDSFLQRVPSAPFRCSSLKPHQRTLNTSTTPFYLLRMHSIKNRAHSPN